MEYFSLKSGEHTGRLRLPAPAVLANKKLLTKEQAGQRDDMNLVMQAGGSTERYADVITSPVCLVSNEIKELFAKYDKTLIFKACRIIREKRQDQALYWLLGVEELDCLAASAVFYPDKRIKHLVLDPAKIGNKPIFKLAETLEMFLVVRLDVAESLLRRLTYGIELKRIATEGEEIEDEQGPV
ncbi:Hypothetical protein LUCI_1366 [Lucifera butyrica]|uniref:Uncharacterized protein n=1 Tax=Lucifera butyrica TaxID=1351585 RepID=A0A498R400_9FIRM|nr:DUF1629 domain-containing protein [Lucifera butyrica]VBB06151.1 Hypothetical protein LUCI_1366 [Lucifera butyrica]